MKEIGKLLELLNEYVEKHNKSDLYYTFELDNGWLFCYDDVTDHKGWTMQDEAMVVCSKKFGFIKWLVENDKIDIKALVVKGEMRSGWDFDNKKGNEEVGEEIWNKYYSELCLMLLAIQENPIDFLCSILK